jgi:neutral ceramidase
MKVGRLQAGVSEIELKPELGLRTANGAPVARGHLTPLYVKALVLANGEDEVAVATLDLIGIDRADAIRAAKLASERSGVPEDGILLTCSHTHVAPSTRSTVNTSRQFFDPGFDEQAKARERAFVNTVVENIARAICDAKEHSQDASIGVVTADLPWLTFNRRRHTRNYGVWTHFMRIPRDQAYRPEGPIDPDLGLFVVRGADYRPLAMVWNFSGHNSFNFGDQYSADLPYTVQEALDERMGEHVPCLYTPGCSGNTNYYDFEKHPRSEITEALKKATEGIASAIMAIYREACTLPEVRLGSRKAELFLAQRDFSRNWRMAEIHAKRPAWDEYTPRELERLRAEAKERETYQSDVMALRLGQAALVGLPGEVFVEFGLIIKERSPFRRTYVASYSNDYVGYIATRRAFIGGSYEVWSRGNCRIGREGGYMMVDKAVELLEELYAG